MLRKKKINRAEGGLSNRNRIITIITLSLVVGVFGWDTLKSNDKTVTTAQADEKIKKQVVKDLEQSQAELLDETNTDEETTMLTEQSSSSEESTSEDSESSDTLGDEAVHEYTLESGDSLTTALGKHDIGFKDVYALTQKFNVLEKELRPGQLITWSVNDDGRLQSLTWEKNRKETRVYELSDDGYVESIEMTPGEWREFVISGEVGQNNNSTLCGSAIDAGLSARECHNAARYLKHQFNLNSLRKGDIFTFFLEREYISDELSSSRLLAAKIKNRGKERYVVYYDKYKSYYGEDGSTFTEGFLRIPSSSLKKFRISSHFNPRRLHPVTKRVSPHKGTDFAMPTGTPIVAAGDGEIMISRYSPSAGNYVAIKHGQRYTTRYMHMSKLAVRAGQIVKRGDLIGYSGNTGRSTGPHLHYEFMVDNKHVNPLKMTLPRPEGLKGNDLKEFKSYVKGVEGKFYEADKMYLAQKQQKETEFKLAKAKQVETERKKAALQFLMDKALETGTAAIKTVQHTPSGPTTERVEL